jgi:hypothetical protein
MVSIPEHPLSFKRQSCELLKRGDETQKSRTEMKLMQALWTKKESKFHIQLSTSQLVDAFIACRGTYCSSRVCYYSRRIYTDYFCLNFVHDYKHSNITYPIRIPLSTEK